VKPFKIKNPPRIWKIPFHRPILFAHWKKAALISPKEEFW
jgi:hypothetical protein